MNNFAIFHHTPKVQQIFGKPSFVFEKIGEVLADNTQDAIEEAKMKGFIAPIVQPM